MMRRFMAATAIATGLALSATGCTGEARDKAGAASSAIKLSAAQILGKSADKSKQIDSFTMNLTMDGHMADGQAKMKGAIQVVLRPQFGMRMNFASMTVDGERVPPFEMRLVGSAVYMKMDIFKEINGGKPWIKFSAKEFGGAAGGMDLQKQLDQAQQQSPAEQIDMLKGTGNIREVGTETIEGVQTRHLSGTLTPQQALGQMDAKERQEFEETYGKLGNSPIAFDVWIGDDELPRKLTTLWTSAKGPLSMTMLYSGYNSQATVAAPPAKQVGSAKIPGLS